MTPCQSPKVLTQVLAQLRRGEGQHGVREAALPMLILAHVLVTAFCGHYFLLEPIGWLCLQLDFPPSVADLFRLPSLKCGTLYRNTSSQLPRCSPSGVSWKRFLLQQSFCL